MVLLLKYALIYLMMSNVS